MEMAIDEKARPTVIRNCRVVPNKANGVPEGNSYGIQLVYSDGSALFIPDVSSRLDEAEELAVKLCGQDVGADIAPYIVYDFLCSRY